MTNETFIRLVVAALAYCDDPGCDHARWTEILTAIYRMRYEPAHAFLSSSNAAGLPNESPAELLLRCHHMAKQLLPQLLREYRQQQAAKENDTNYAKFLREQADTDLFLDGANLTRDAYAGPGDVEPERPAKLDRWGNVVS
jgi:hypothetical protein